MKSNYRIVSYENHDGVTKYQLQYTYEGSEDWQSLFTSSDLEEVREARKKREAGLGRKFTVVE